MRMTASAYGTADSAPVEAIPCPDSDLTIVGSPVATCERVTMATRLGTRFGPIATGLIADRGPSRAETGACSSERATELVNRCGLLPVEHTEHRVTISPGEEDAGQGSRLSRLRGGVRYGAARDGLSAV